MNQYQAACSENFSPRAGGNKVLLIRSRWIYLILNKPHEGRKRHCVKVKIKTFHLRYFYLSVKKRLKLHTIISFSFFFQALQSVIQGPADELKNIFHDHSWVCIRSEGLAGK